MADASKSRPRFEGNKTHRALFAEHVLSQKDMKILDFMSKHGIPCEDTGLPPGRPFSVEDHLFILWRCSQFGMSDEKVAEALGTPLAYIRSMRAAGSGIVEET